MNYGSVMLKRMRLPSRAAWLIAPVMAGTLAFSCIFALVQVLSRYQIYDDEGYVMMSLRSYLEGKPLYDRVYTQYGPFYYLVKAFLFRLTGLSLTHDHTREIVALFWIATAVALAFAVWNICRYWLPATMAFLQFTLLLSSLANEPGHPQDLVVLLSALGLAVGSFSAGRTPPGRSALFVLGLIAGALLFTKINIGVYFTAALVLTLVQLSQLHRRWPALASAVVCLGIWLTIRHPVHWGGALAVLSSVAVLTCAAVAQTSDSHAPTSVVRKGSYLYGIAGLFVLSLLACVTQLARGTSVHGLIEGLLLQSLRLSSLMEFRAPIPVWAIPLVLVSAALCARAVIRGDLTRQGMSARSTDAVALVKVITALAVVLNGLLDVTDLDPQRLGAVKDVALAPAFFWIWLLPLHSDDQGAGYWFPRLLIANFAAIQVLHMYPVAGSQASWALLPVILFAYIALADGSAHFLGSRPAYRSGCTEIPSILVFLAFAVLAVQVSRFDEIVKSYISRSALDLPGAHAIRFNQETAANLHWVVANLDKRCDGFVSATSMNSLYFFTGMNPPTDLNVTFWQRLLNNGQQQTIVRAMAAYSHPCAVVNQWPGTVEEGVDYSGSPLAYYVSRSLVLVRRGPMFSLRASPRDAAQWDRDYLIAGERRFEANGDIVPVLPSLLQTSSGTVLLRFQTRAGGALLGAQNSEYSRRGDWQGGAAILEITPAGMLQAMLPGSTGAISRPARVPPRVNDGLWHHAALVWTQHAQRLYLDGACIATGPREATHPDAKFAQLGAANGAALFRGAIREAAISARDWSDAEIASDARTNAPR